MAKLKQFVTQIVMDEQAQGLTEYGLIIAVVALVVIGALSGLGSSLASKFGCIASAIAGNAGSSGC